MSGGRYVDGTDPLRIGLLGELTASSGGEVLDLGGRRQRAVLALLLLARGEVVRADRLVESLWGEWPPANAVGVLQSYVSHLRRRLQPGSAARARSGVIVSEGRGYAVRLPKDAVDAWRFEALVHQAGGAADPARTAALLGQALELWRGPALADHADEPWAEAEIVRLDELRAVAREQLLAARLELGESALLVPELETMVNDEPLREERWRLLALALYRAGRQADALAALRRARTTLADQLGIDPGPGLRALESEVLAQSPSLDTSARPGPVAPPAGPTTPPPVVPGGDDLVDRDRELAAVRAVLDDLVAGEPRVLLVEGPAGIGKTRLLVETRRLAVERSVRVLSARGSQLEQAFGFGVVRQLFEPELNDPDRRTVLLGGPAASARGVFDPAGDEPADGSFAVLHGLYRVAVELARSGPLLLAVDDVQWCDDASLRYLAFLVRRLEAVPVLLAGTVRTGEERTDDALLAELALEPTALVLRPAPLSPERTAEMVAARLGSPVSRLFATACHRTTSGNPLLLRQLLRGLEADGVRPDAAHADTVVAVGSRAVSSMLLMRLRRLPPEITAVARAAAVLGDGAPLPAVAALAGVAESDTAEALAVLTRAEVVKDEQPLQFVHPLARDAVYRDLPAAQRELWHERAAQVLRGSGASAEQLGAHLLLAPRRADPDTVAVLRAAARTAVARGATESAVTHLRRALAEPPPATERCDVLLELGLVESRRHGPASTEHLRSAYELLDDGPRRAEMAVAIARTEVFAGAPGVATAFAREAAAALPPELADHRQALHAIERIGGFMHGLDAATWRTAPPEPSGDGTGAQMLAAALAWEKVLDGADRDGAIALARFALDRDRLWEVDDGLFWIVAAVVRMLADDDLGDFWARARAQAHRRGSLFAVMSTSQWEGTWHRRRGELDEALACVAAALDQMRMWGGNGGVGEPHTRAVEIGCHLDRGDVAAARRAADAGLAGPRLGDAARVLHQETARVLVAEGRHADALAWLDATPAPLPIANPVHNPWRSITASALHGLGRTAEALDLIADEVALLRRWGAPTYLGAALRLHGELRGAAGVDLLREAVAVLTSTDAVVELARARCALGSVAAVPDAEAVPHLQAAAEVADAAGALGVRDDACDALLGRGSPEGVRCDRVRRLSETERRILDLAASGLPVQEVAQQLFLTPGTVRAVLEAAPELPA